MFERNPKNAFSILQYVAPADAAAGTVNGVAVDTTGYAGVGVIVLAGTIDADHTATVKLQHGDAVATSATDADSVALVAANSDSQKKLGYARKAVGKQARVQIVRAGSNSSAIGYIIIGFNADEAPAA